MEHIFEQQQLSTIMYKTNNESKDNSHISNLSDNIFSNINKFKHEEYQYLNLIEHILENGFWE